MEFLADLHVHSKYSRGCSKDLDIKNLEKYARIKGIHLLGTGDFTHPKWIAEIKSSLEDNGEGILKTRTGFGFLLQTEISLVYTQGGKGRRIHHVVLAPDIGAAEQITEYLKKKGRVDYDGRPIFNITSYEFVEALKAISKDIEVIPAHIWTPWFGMLGSKSGFDSVEECFKDQVKHIYALETGLSSDPEMNWMLSSLDKYNLVSFSDLHSYWPWRIGREATLFDADFSYKGIIGAIRQKKGRIIETIEVDPGYGKYHLDGHRNCNVVMQPGEAIKNRNICPVCKKPLTIGVLHRVNELADRPFGFKPKNAHGFRRMIPLAELISKTLSKGIATKSVFQEYYKLVKYGQNENNVMLNMPYNNLLKITSKKLADLIMLNRFGKIRITPGYDGVYGKIVLDDSSPNLSGEGIKNNIKESNAIKAPTAENIKKAKKQLGLDDFF